jgi:hypothetical protein
MIGILPISLGLLMLSMGGMIVMLEPNGSTLHKKGCVLCWFSVRLLLSSTVLLL